MEITKGITADYAILGKLICVKKLHKNSPLTAISAIP